ncbi:hypothetical protein [Rhodoglobus aureus]|uniref:Uncharacterized protein n=1 Tax=Rhodoglobus aureus TaxID=191497 RepID=A0ABN1VYG5_9MICO
MHLTQPRGFHNPAVLDERRRMLEGIDPADPLRQWISRFEVAPRLVLHFEPADAASKA